MCRPEPVSRDAELGVTELVLIVLSAVLAVALMNVTEGRGFLLSATWGFCTALGFSLVLVIFAAARARLATADVPNIVQGAPIALITAGFMALAFSGFAGLGGAAG